MNTNALNDMVQKNISESEDEIGYEMTEADLEYTQKMISRLSGYYVRKDEELNKKRKIKQQRRRSNKVARQSRRTNRK